MVIAKVCEDGCDLWFERGLIQVNFFQELASLPRLRVFFVVKCDVHALMECDAMRMQL